MISSEASCLPPATPPRRRRTGRLSLAAFWAAIDRKPAPEEKDR